MVTRLWGVDGYRGWPVEEVFESLWTLISDMEEKINQANTYREPNVMSLLRGCSELHLALWSGHYDAVLVYTRRERVRVHDRLHGVDVS